MQNFKLSVLAMGVFVLGIVLGIGCERADEMPATSMGAEAPFEQLGATLAGELVQARHQARTTNVLSMVPDMDREDAYIVQMAALGIQEAAGEQLVGWKMGGTRLTNPDADPDPSFAYILRSDSLADGAEVSAATYVAGDLMVEAEIAFIIGEDLAGTTHSPEAVRAAVEAVAGAIELIDVRIVASDDGNEPTMDHMVAANLSHAGVILTETRMPMDAIDVAAETATVFVDDVEAAMGAGSQIMGTSPFDALVWIANALPAQGKMLRAGDIVITGGLYDNPIITAGQQARVSFSTLGELSVSMGD